MYHQDKSKLRSKNTVVHKRDELCRKPLRSATDGHNTPTTSTTPGRKRNMASAEASERAQTEQEDSTPKRMKMSDAPVQSSPEAAGSSCVIL